MQVPVFKTGHLVVEVFLEDTCECKNIRKLNPIEVKLGFVHAFDKRLDGFD